MKFLDVGCLLGKYAIVVGVLQVCLYVGMRLGHKYPMF